jgi:hypothetical protein
MSDDKPIWVKSKQDEWEWCKGRNDQTHCAHWWDGGRCCSCGANARDYRRWVKGGEK